jgi:hypothetical protein
VGLLLSALKKSPVYDLLSGGTAAAIPEKAQSLEQLTSLTCLNDELFFENPENQDSQTDFTRID